MVQQVQDPPVSAAAWSSASSIPTVVQWFKNSALPQLCCQLQLQLGFDPWPRNFCFGKKKQKQTHRHREQTCGCQGR